MNKFYIQDSTLGNKYITFNTVPELVDYLKSLIPRAFGISKEAYIQNLLDLGYGYDDSDGIMLTRVLSENFNIGIIRNGNYMKCDVHDASNSKEELGNASINRFEDRGRI